MNDIIRAQWTSASTAGDAYLDLGFVPSGALIVIDVNADAAPEVYLWTNPATIQGQASVITDTDQVVRLFGAANALTGAAVETHDGGDDVPDPNTTYFTRGGELATVGDNSGKGLKILAALQNDDADNVIIAWRDDTN